MAIILKIGLLFVSSFLIMTSASAQNNDSKDFFTNDFVKGAEPQAAKDRAEPTPEESRPQIKSYPAVKKATKNQKDDPFETIDVINVSLVIEGLDLAAGIKTLNSMLRFIQAKDFSLDQVIFVGVPNFPRELRQSIVEISARGGSFSYGSGDDLPFELEFSPALIVNTADGIFIIEAEGNLEKFFNTKGELIPHKFSSIAD